MRVLVCDPAEGAVAKMTAVLTEAGIFAEAAEPGDDIADMARVYAYDAIVLGPPADEVVDLAAIQAVRRAGIPTPILVLSQAALPFSAAHALNAGADDVMAKPMHHAEFLARVHAVIRRSVGLTQMQVSAGPIVVDMVRKVAIVDGVEVNLTAHAYQVLELMALRKGKTVSKDTFMSHLYGGMDEPGIKIIDVYVHQLRRKFEAARAGAGSHIRNAYGSGYRLDDAPGDWKPDGERTVVAPLETVAGRILVALAAGDLGYRQISERFGAEAKYLRHEVASLTAPGLIANVNDRHRALYRITPRGLAWLRDKGWTPAETTA